jgi:hypothetical protein
LFPDFFYAKNKFTDPPVAKKYVDRKSQNPANLGTQDQCSSRSKVFFLKQFLNGEKKKRAPSVSPSSNSKSQYWDSYKRTRYNNNLRERNT